MLKIKENVFLSFLFFFSVDLFRDDNRIRFGRGVSCGIGFNDDLTSSYSSMIWVYWKEKISKSNKFFDRK